MVVVVVVVMVDVAVLMPAAVRSLVSEVEQMEIRGYAGLEWFCGSEGPALEQRNYPLRYSI